MKKLHNLISYADSASKIIIDPRDDVLSKFLELSKEILHEDRTNMQNQSMLLATTVKTEKLEELQTVQPSPDSSSQEVDHTRSEESLKSLIESSGSVFAYDSLLGNVTWKAIKLGTQFNLETSLGNLALNICLAWKLLRVDLSSHVSKLTIADFNRYAVFREISVQFENLHKRVSCLPNQEIIWEKFKVDLEK